MAAEITDITERNRVDMESLLSTVAEIAERTRRMEADLHALAVAFSTGGARGLRTLARSFADRAAPVDAGHFERRQSDGTWQRITREEAIEGGWGQ